MSKKFKKYTLAEKKEYWADVFDKEDKKRDGGSVFSDKQRYSEGFLIASKRGRLSNDFNECPLSERMGQIAGFKAKINDIRRQERQALKNLKQKN